MATLVLQPNEADSQDCNIANGASASTNSNVGTLLAGTFRVLSVDTLWRALIRFDISGIPTGTTITAATFTLTFDGGAPIGGATYRANRMTEPDWTETGATWNTYDGVNNWASSGGDFTATNAATVVYASGTELEFDVLAMLQDALDSGLDYLDLIIRGPEISGSSSYVVGLSSAENTESERPKLEITYASPGCVTIELTHAGTVAVALSGCDVRRLPSMGYDITNQGAKPTSTATFKQDDVLADPDTVSVIVLAPDGTETTYVYDTDSEVVRDSLGVYHIDIDVTQGGRWYHRWIATGDGQAAEQQWFEARAAVVGE